MTKLGFCAFALVSLAVLQAGCTSEPNRRGADRSPPEAFVPGCDTSVRTIELVSTIRNDSDADIEFNLVGDRGSPFDLWYRGYSVYASAPGEPFQLVHNSGQNSLWTRKVAIAAGGSAEFKTPIFGLKPADYFRNFRIGVRDSKSRTYWTPVFQLCAFSRPAAGARDRAPLPAAPRPAPPEFRG
jgi:hypothetical protein